MIYIVDYIGIHCGMHYYLDAFKQILETIPDCNVKILSNYSDENEKPFFVNNYRGNIIDKIGRLILNYLKFWKFLKSHKKDFIIYLTYGNRIDIPFLRTLSNHPHHVVDIHEAIAQNVDCDEKLKNKFKHLYRDKIKTVISHSKRTDDFLEEYGFRGYKFDVPHFRYRFPKNYSEENISTEIKESIDPSKINLLFFGNLNESKGVDILIESVNMLSNEYADRLNVIIAGKDFDGSVDRVKPRSDRHIQIFKRHISDDELRFLYQNVDYISLPYRKTSQSGILEMAFYFKKPIIATDVPYFKKILEEFSSFGILSGKDSIDYSMTLSEVIKKHCRQQFFQESEYCLYQNRKEINAFVKDFYHWLLSLVTKE